MRPRQSQLPKEVELLADLACQIALKGHPYVSQNSDCSFHLCAQRLHRRFSDLQCLIDRCVFHLQNRHSPRLSTILAVSLEKISHYLQKKIAWRWPWSRAHRVEQIQDLVDKIEGYRALIDTQEVKPCETLARLSFFEALPKRRLGRRRAPSTEEYTALKLVSQVIWRRSPSELTGELQPYLQHMMELYAGRHFRVQENPDKPLLSALKELKSCTLVEGPKSKRTRSHHIQGPFMTSLAFGREAAAQDTPYIWLCRDPYPPQAGLRQLLMRYTWGKRRQRRRQRRPITVRRQANQRSK